MEATTDLGQVTDKLNDMFQIYLTLKCATTAKINSEEIIGHTCGCNVSAVL